MIFSTTYIKRPFKNFSLFLSHFSSTTRDVNKVVLYLQRAKFIDSIRLCLRLNASETYLIDLLNSPGLCSFVISNALRSAPSPTSALYLIETLRKIPHFTHTKHTLYSLANILSKSGQTGKLKALVNAIDLGKFVNVFPVSFMDRMRWYAAAGDLDEVISVWEEWRKTMNRHPCTESYNIVMKLFVEKGLDTKAVNVFLRMIEEGALPNCRTYTIMIEHLVKFGKLDLAFEIFQMLPIMRIKRSLKQYYTLVEAFSGTDQFESVETLLCEMQVDGMLPGPAMRLSLQRMKDAGYCDYSEKLMKEMVPDERIKSISSSFVGWRDDSDEEGEESEDSGDTEEEVKLKPWLDPAALASALKHWRPDEVYALEDANFVWTNRFVCKLIRNLKSPETAWSFFCWVAHQPGYIHDVHTISRMITKLARNGFVQLVDQLIFKIKREGLILSVSTVRLVIDFYGLSRKGDAALNIFRGAKTICGSLSEANQLIIYSSLLRTLTKCEMNSEVMDTLEEMILLGIFPDLQTFSGLMQHYALQADISTVQKLFGMVRQSDLVLDAYTYNTVICGYCKCGRASLALRVFEDMRNFGFMADSSTKVLLIKSLWKEGKLREVALVEEISGDNGREIPPSLQGNAFTLKAADLARVYEIYSSSFDTNYRES